MTCQTDCLIHEWVNLQWLDDLPQVASLVATCPAEMPRAWPCCFLSYLPAHCLPRLTVVPALPSAQAIGFFPLLLGVF